MFINLCEQFCIYYFRNRSSVGVWSWSGQPAFVPLFCNKYTAQINYLIRLYLKSKCLQGSKQQACLLPICQYRSVAIQPCRDWKMFHQAVFFALITLSWFTRNPQVSWYHLETMSFLIFTNYDILRVNCIERHQGNSYQAETIIQMGWEHVYEVLTSKTVF